MKTRNASGFLVAFSLTALQISAQQVGTTDVIALLDELPKPTQNVADAYKRSYATKDATKPDAKAAYKSWLDKLDVAVQEIQTLSKDFYTKNPMGIAPSAQPTASKASSSQQSAMQAATSELAQKMMTDPAFAQKFKQMSEQEQREYITQLMASKGLTPVQGVANSPSSAPAGLDEPWAEICSEIMTSAHDRTLLDEQITLQTRFDAWHEEVRQWANREMKKVPLISMGEYGHEADPVQVKAIEKKARFLHREIADVTMKDMAALFAKIRHQMVQRFDTFNTKLKKVNYGKTYNFGIHYPLILQTQGFAIQSLDVILNNEIAVIEACAKWEHEQVVNQ